MAMLVHQRVSKIEKNPQLIWRPSFHPSHKPRGSANQLAMTVEIKVQVGMAAKPASGEAELEGHDVVMVHYI